MPRFASLLSTAAVGAVLLSQLTVLSAGAADFSVTTSADAGPGSLRQALFDADATPGADTITIAPGLAPIVLNSTVRVTSPFALVGNGVTITRSGEFDLLVVSDMTEPGSLSFDGVEMEPNGFFGRGIVVNSSPISPEEVSISNSRFSALGYPRATTLGGGVAVLSRVGRVSVADSLFEDNSGYYGGGLYVLGGGVSVSGSAFVGNEALVSGGGLFIAGVTSDSEVTTSLFEGNVAENAGTTPSVNGAAIGFAVIAVGVTMRVFQSEFVENVGVSGRYGLVGVAIAGFSVLGELIVDSSTFEAQRRIYSDTSQRDPSDPRCGWSVGVRSVTGDGLVQLVNSTFLEGVTVRHQGVEDFYVLCAREVGADATVRMDHSTVYADGGVRVVNNAGTVSVYSTIIDAINPVGVLVNAGNPVDVEWSVLTSDVDPTMVTDIEGNQFAVADTLLGPLQDNGGPTRTMMLLPGGPAVGTGRPSPKADEPLLEQRSDGFPRRDGPLDIGAVELPFELPTLPFGEEPPTGGRTQLAATGISMPVALFGAGGVLVMLIGVGGVLLAQRRRRA